MHGGDVVGKNPRNHARKSELVKGKICRQLRRMPAQSAGQDAPGADVDSEFDGILDINDKYKTRYACWLSPSVFYVPTEKGDKEARITVTSSNTVDLKQGDEQFYALDLDTLSEVVKKLQAKRADSISMTNGNVAIHTQAKKGESLYVSVPFDSGWAVTVNGKKVSPELFADCMYSIELVDGENDIQMKYQVPEYRLGVIVSIIGVLGVFGLVLQQKRGKKHRRG